MISSCSSSEYNAVEGVVRAICSLYKLDYAEVSLRVSLSSYVGVSGSGKRVAECPLPFLGVVTESCCGVKLNYKLFTQCVKDRVEGSSYCVKCKSESDENPSEKPKYGDIRDRVASGEKEGYLSYRINGQSVLPLANVMTRRGLSREDVEAYAASVGVMIPEEQFVVRVTKRGRPKKSIPVSDTREPNKSRVVEKSSGCDDDDLLSALHNAADNHEAPFVCEFAGSVDSDAISADSKASMAAEKKAEREAKKAAKAEQVAVEKAEKKAAREAKKAAKAEQVAVEKAEKKAAREAKKAAKAEQVAVEKAEKKAAREAKKAAKAEQCADASSVSSADSKASVAAEKKAAREAKKAAKAEQVAVEKAEKKAAREAKKAAKAEQVAVEKAEKKAVREAAKLQREVGVRDRLQKQLEKLSATPCSENIEEMKTQVKILKATAKAPVVVAVVSSPCPSMESLELSEDEFDSSDEVEEEDEMELHELVKFEHDGQEYLKRGTESDGQCTLFATDGSLNEMGTFDPITQTIEEA